MLNGESCTLYICTYINKTKLSQEYVYTIAIVLASITPSVPFADNIT